MSARGAKGRAAEAAVLGAGRMGRAVASILLSRGRGVRVWARRELALRQMASELDGVVPCALVEEACEGVDLIFVAVPAPALIEVASRLGEVARGDQIVVHACRGVSNEAPFLLPHEAIRRETCIKKIGVLGGPLYADDLGTGRPLYALVASRYDEVPTAVRALSEGTPVKLHQSRDIVGVEVAGAISNVTALAAGMCDTLGLGETARGVLLMHGLSEATKVGVALGAEPVTFFGLAGTGDLIPREVSSTLCNHRVGALLAEGRPIDEALREVQGVVEGVVTAREARRLAERQGLSLPLITAVSDVLDGAKGAREALEDVLSRDLALGRELF